MTKGTRASIEGAAPKTGVQAWVMNHGTRQQGAVHHPNFVVSLDGGHTAAPKEAGSADRGSAEHLATLIADSDLAYRDASILRFGQYGEHAYRLVELFTGPLPEEVRRKLIPGTTPS